ncbi:hypothetical protein MMC24_006454 [Lignoscripta atroalba]|nr:hypothetical protein [Lignoscripta atroalba]
MSFMKTAALVAAIASISRVTAHGTVSGIVADGTYYRGYNPSFQFSNPAPIVVGWSIPNDLDNGFIAPDSYTNPDIICHKGATNAKTSATVRAGGTVQLQWTTWPESHHGPVIDYLANCGGDCTTVDKTQLRFVKIDGVGLIDGSSPPGTWASDQLIANNNSWTVTIPATVAPGNYVLRHEIIGLHSAGTVNGAQNYPQCINLRITGSGSNSLSSGTPGTALYKNTDPGILINIYQVLRSYVVPGPASGNGAPGSSVPASTVRPTSTVRTTSTARPTSTARTTSSSRPTFTPRPTFTTRTRFG